MRTLTFLTAFYGAATLGVPFDVPAAQQDPILGTWSLNVEASDDPQEVMQNMRGGRGRPGGGVGGRGGVGRGRAGGRGGGRGGGGRRGVGGGDQGGGGQRGPRGGPMALIMRPVDRLSIEMVESNLNIVAANRRALLLHTDGERWTEIIDGQGEVEFKVKHKDGELDVERTFNESGMTLKETYKFDEDEDRLEVTARLSGGRLPRRIQIKRVYDRVEMQ